MYTPSSVGVHDFLVNKINRCSEFQFYWYYDSACFGQPFCPSSGVLSRTSAVVHFMQLWSRSLQLHKMYHSRCTAKNSWWWAERLTETCRVIIPIKLEFSAYVGLIHKESVTMHGHTIGKKCLDECFLILRKLRRNCLFEQNVQYKVQKQSRYMLTVFIRGNKNTVGYMWYWHWFKIYFQFFLKSLAASSRSVCGGAVTQFQRR
jgi:hypothetical protein